MTAGGTNGGFMNGLKAVKAAELRSRLAAIPAKILLALVIAGGMFWDTDLAATFDRIKAEPVLAFLRFVILYGVLSYIHFFVRLFKSYILGIVVAALSAYAVYTLKDRLTAQQFRILIISMLLCGPVVDILRFFRYTRLRREVIEESEGLKNRIDDIYENVHGYDEGYDRGYEYGYEKGRQEKLSRRKHGRIDEREYDDRIEEYDDGDDYRDDRYYDEEDDGRHVEEQSRPRLEMSGFFDGCKTPESIKKRYRDLCKVYHPDSGNGSEVIFEAICDEYNRLMDE